MAQLAVTPDAEFWAHPLSLYAGRQNRWCGPDHERDVASRGTRSTVTVKLAKQEKYMLSMP